MAAICCKYWGVRTSRRERAYILGVFGSSKAFRGHFVPFNVLELWFSIMHCSHLCQIQAYLSKFFSLHQSISYVAIGDCHWYSLFFSCCFSTLPCLVNEISNITEIAPPICTTKPKLNGRSQESCENQSATHAYSVCIGCVTELTRLVRCCT